MTTHQYPNVATTNDLLIAWRDGRSWRTIEQVLPKRTLTSVVTCEGQIPAGNVDRVRRFAELLLYRYDSLLSLGSTLAPEGIKGWSYPL